MELWNQLGFTLRDRLLGRLRLRRGLPETARFRALCPGEGAFYSLLLERALGARGGEGIATVWDIGCRNWSYAEALARAFPTAHLVGVELDGGVRYRGLHRRRDVAESFAAELRARGRQVDCRFGDFRLEDVRTPGAPAAFCFFFPFVSADPCRSWGLPTRYADFGALLGHALGAPGAPLLLSAHQGEWETEIAREAYRACGQEPREEIVRAAEFAGLWPGEHDVHLLTSSARPGIRPFARD